MADTAARALQLIELDPALGGIITVGFRIDPPCQVQRIPPNAALRGYQTPWGWQPGLLDHEGPFSADLDMLPPESLAVLAQRLDEGGAVLLASAAEAPWAHLADRVAFLIARDAPCPRPPQGRPLSLNAAAEAIARTATAWQVEGHRAESFALRAALAIARADGRRRLYEGDVTEAISLVLAPRARSRPQEQPHTHQPPTEARPASQSADDAEAPPLATPAPLLPVTPAKPRPALHGAPVRSIPGRRRKGSLDLPGTLLAALPWQRLRQGALRVPPVIRPSDLRWHLHRPRQGRLVIFAVDASGSMGRRRLGQAKGAVLSLLHQAYRHRDQVALIIAAGAKARLLLPPARAVEQARRALVAVPVGGGTPLAGALLLALQMALAARARDQRESLLLLLTDGRANQPLPGTGTSPADVQRQLKQSSLALRQAAVKSVVLSEPGAEARDLSGWLGAPLLPVTQLRRAPATPSGATRFW